MEKESLLTENLLKIAFIIDPREEMEIEAWALFARDELKRELEKWFPEFKWSLEICKRHDFPRSIPRDPLCLLEFGADVKIENGYDFLIILTTLPIKARFSQGINCVVSAMLETAVVSLSKILEMKGETVRKEGFISLMNHVLGRLWGLDHHDTPVMRPRKYWHFEKRLEWTEEEIEKIKAFLVDVADPRVEETSHTASSFKFVIAVLLKEGTSILRDIIFSKSWHMVLNLGRFTGATAVSIIFLFLSAEAWEMGAALDSKWLDLGLVGVIIASALSIYFGQNLQSVGKSDKMVEQAVRSRIILLGTLFIGMASFWLNLLIISYIIIALLPERVLTGWAGLGSNPLPVFHFAKLMATFGVLASAVGGNLEEEQDIKAVLIYTEET